jgi:hypothetical protein
VVPVNLNVLFEIGTLHRLPESPIKAERMR